VVIVADLPVLWAARPSATRTANACCAPSSPTSPHTLRSDQTKPTVGLRFKSGASQQLPVTRRRNAIQLRDLRNGGQRLGVVNHIVHRLILVVRVSVSLIEEEGKLDAEQSTSDMAGGAVGGPAHSVMWVGAAGR
jgi:hypothetical protein